jgi:hypothetical protein
MDLAAQAEIKHLISCSGEMRAVDNDARDKWNGAKKVMNCSEKKQLLLEPGGHNLDPAELFPLLFRFPIRQLWLRKFSCNYVFCIQPFRLN